MAHFRGSFKSLEQRTTGRFLWPKETSNLKREEPMKTTSNATMRNWLAKVHSKSPGMSAMVAQLHAVNDHRILFVKRRF